MYSCKMMDKSDKYCFVPFCKSSNKRNPEKIFFNVPKHEEKRKKWFLAAKRDPASAGVKTTLSCCQDHFDVESDMQNYIKYKLLQGNCLPFLKPDVIPHKFVCQEGAVEKTHPSVLRSMRKVYCPGPNDKLVEKVKQIESVSVSKSITPQVTGSNHDDEFVERVKLIESVSHNESISSQITGFGVQVDNKVLTTDKCTQLIFSENHIAIKHSKSTFICGVDRPDKTVQCNLLPEAVSSSTSSLKRSAVLDPANSTPRKKVRSAEEYSPPAVSDIISVTASQCLPSTSTNSSGSKEDERSTFASMHVKCTIYAIENNSKAFLAINSNALRIIDFLVARCCSSRRNVFLCLKKVKKNSSFLDLGIDFGISGSQAFKIFRSTLPKLACQMKHFIMWLDKKYVQNFLPVPFRKDYSNVISIIDCLEIEIKKPSDHRKQLQTWSEYYGCNTIKYMVSCTPHGLINFCSKGYGGRSSDMEIVKTCSFMNYLVKGDAVMADRGFKKLGAVLRAKDCILVRPPSVVKGENLTFEQEKFSKQVASLRVHVEQVIGRFREFRFFGPNSCVDHNLVDILDCALILVAGLVNIHNSLFK